MVVKKILSKLKRKKKPGFKRQEGYRFVKLKDTWRRPRGRHSKLRKGEKARGKKPSIGYRSPEEARGKTKNGFIPRYVSNVSDLKNIDAKNEAIVIRKTVGKKKRMGIILEAEKKNIQTVNAYKFKIGN